MRSGTLRGICVGIGTAMAAGLLGGLPAYAARPDVARAGSAWPLLAWGDNQFGELGDGTVMNESAPIAVNRPADLKVVSARSAAFAVAVTTDGRVLARGDDAAGDLGTGANVRIVAISSGRQHGLALSNTGKVYSTGASLMLCAARRCCSSGGERPSPLA